MVNGLRNSNRSIFTICGILLSTINILIADLTSLSKSDPYPVFTAVDPLVDRYLLTKQICDFREEYVFRTRNDCMMLSISPFKQYADRGRNIKNEAVFRRVPVQLGDILPLNGGGRWGLIPLLFGALPDGVTPTTYATNYPTLQKVFTDAATNAIVPVGSSPGTVECVCASPCAPTNFSDANKVDPNQRCGYITVPLHYSHAGIRFSFSARSACSGFGLNIEGGVSRIKQTVQDLCDPYCNIPVCDSCTDSINSGSDRPVLDFQGLDLTNYQTSPICNDLPEFIGPEGSTNFDPCLNIIGVTKANIQTYLTRPFDCIAKEIGLDITDFCEISSEELRFNLFWTEAYEFNKDSYEWSYLAIIPSIMGGISVSPGKAKNEHKAFAAYFGNNKHTAIGFSAGLYFDFAQTIQFGGEAGYTHFFKRTYNDLRIPNSKFQTGIFPFFTDAYVQPGDNTYFSLKILAYHFLDTLSVYVQYNQVDHMCDCIKPVVPDSAFLPHVLEGVTPWSNKTINAGATYDILPNFGLGFLYQAPVSQRNTYRSTTLLLSVYAFF